MGFVIRQVGQLACPALLCDYCEKPVEDWTKANVHFEWPDSVIQSPRIVHKRCWRTDAKSKSAYGWMPLERYIGRLLWNNGWGKRKPRPKAATDEITIEVDRGD